ncbi:MAG: hypothetical protein JRH12_08395 [Deltaproteobacteria bacterium]|jgi:hypothetical protein|nr:hypothetical protein [Deltaproteobacteria bacterium]MBW2478482.1 hypothetical protein [Deltaproteobacteria bacterium]
MTTAYRHRQFGTTLVVILLAGIAVAAVILSRYGWHPLGIFAIVILIICILLFYSLRVEVKGGLVRCRFGCGLIGKKFLLAEIIEAQPVINKWYYGWGIRLTPHGWLFNVSGRQAVEITLRSGKKYRIGTDEPERLADAIGKNLR